MNPRQEFEDRLAAALAELRGAGLLRQMRLPIGIDLVSNDYLGLAEHPHLTETMRADRRRPSSRVRRFASSARSSRDFRDHRRAARLVQRLRIGVALWIRIRGKHRIAAGRRVARRSDRVGRAQSREPHRRHPPDEGGDRDLSAPGLECARGGALATPERARVRHHRKRVQHGWRSDAAREVCDIAERAGAVVIVDEAHATGMYGARGSGRVEELGLRDRVVATMHTGGKALGSGGAWVAGSRALRDVMVNRARSFIFSTAPLPVLGAALGAGLYLVEREPERRREVHRKASLLRGALRDNWRAGRRRVDDRADHRGCERGGDQRCSLV